MAMKRAPDLAGKPEPAAVLAKSMLRAAELLEVPRRSLARALGVSEATLSRSAAGRAIDPAAKEGELALLFVRLFRSLDALFGGDVENMRTWFHAENDHLVDVPAAMIERVEGLVRVVDYLDAMRGKI